MIGAYPMTRPQWSYVYPKAHIQAMCFGISRRDRAELVTGGCAGRRGRSLPRQRRLL